MRKIKEFCSSIKRVYAVFEIKGNGIVAFIEYLKRKGITVYSTKIIDKSTYIIKVKIKESKNIFAIANKLCYNIKLIEKSGAFYPIYYLIRNLGIVIGGLSFIILSYINSFVLLDFSYTGSGKILKRQIQNYLTENNVTKFRTFNSIDFDKLANDILIYTDELTFVSVYKNGNRLVIDSAIKTGEEKKEKKEFLNLYSDTAGVVESVKVYKGSAVVKEGAEIKKGDLLVSGICKVKEQEVKSNVIAKVSIIVKKEVEFKLERENDEEAIILAEQTLFGREIIDRKTEKKYINGEYEYKIELFYRHIVETE